MGKVTSIYLTDSEVAELKKFCEENQCTQYSALKIALRELTSKPEKKKFLQSLLKTTLHKSLKVTKQVKKASMRAHLDDFSEELIFSR